MWNTHTGMISTAYRFLFCFNWSVLSEVTPGVISRLVPGPLMASKGEPLGLAERVFFTCMMSSSSHLINIPSTYRNHRTNICGKISRPILSSACLNFGNRKQLHVHSVLMTPLVRQQEEHPACKKQGIGLLVATIWLELCTSCSSSCNHLLHHP